MLFPAPDGPLRTTGLGPVIPVAQAPVAEAETVADAPAAANLGQTRHQLMEADPEVQTLLRLAPPHPVLHHHRAPLRGDADAPPRTSTPRRASDRAWLAAEAVHPVLRASSRRFPHGSPRVNILVP